MVQILGAGQASYSGGFASGLHTITAKVTDTFGNNASDAVTIVVRNEPPTVNITSPAADSSFIFGTPIDFTATASDPEGESLIVQWSSSLDGPFGTGDLLGYAALSVGEHTITAFVQDSLGNTATSTVLITITPLPASELAVIVDPVMPNPASMADTITFTARVTKDGLPAQGALVSFWIDFPKIDLTLTVVTDELGSAEATYKVNTKKTGIGDAYVIATVTLAGFAPVISDKVAFKIQ